MHKAAQTVEEGGHSMLGYVGASSLPLGNVVILMMSMLIKTWCGEKWDSFILSDKLHTL